MFGSKELALKASRGSTNDNELYREPTFFAIQISSSRDWPERFLQETVP